MDGSKCSMCANGTILATMQDKLQGDINSQASFSTNEKTLTNLFTTKSLKYTVELASADWSSLSLSETEELVHGASIVCGKWAKYSTHSGPKPTVPLGTSNSGIFPRFSGHTLTPISLKTSAIPVRSNGTGIRLRRAVKGVEIDTTLFLCDDRDRDDGAPTEPSGVAYEEEGFASAPSCAADEYRRVSEGRIGDGVGVYESVANLLVW